MPVYSLDNLGVPHTEQNDLCYLPRHEWLRLIHLDCPDILLIEVCQGDVQRILTVGEAHDNEDAIYIPYNCIGAFSEGENVEIRRYTHMPPIATLITIQPLETELYQCDIAAAVSKVLANMNVLHNHTTLKVPCEELGGYIVEVFIKDCMPEDIVLLRGECPLEISEIVDDLPPPSAPSAPSAPPSTPPSTPSALNELVEIPEQKEEIVSKTGFVPFSGAGRRLGS